MSDKIGYEDLFDPNIQAKYKALTDAFVEGLKKYRDELKSGLADQKEFFTGFKVSRSEDIKKLNEELEKTNKKLTDLTAANKAVEQSEKELAKLRVEEIKLMRSREKSIDDFTKKETDAAKKKLKLQEQERLSEIQLQKAREKAFDRFEKENRAYVKLSKEVSNLKNAYKDAAVAEGEMSKKAQDLLSKLTPLEQKLRKIDSNVGDFQRNVGNYQSALSQFGGAANQVLGAAGIGIGITAGVNFLKDSVQEFTKFESALQNLSAITGASGKDLEFYKEQAKELGINVKGGASAVVEAYKLIGSAKPELLENKEALNEVTKSAILLSQAAGLELPDAATRLTDALNQYGASADQAGKFTDVLAAAAKAGAAEVPDVTDSLLKFGVAAKSSNITIQESAAAIEVLAEKGLKGSQAGEKLNVIFTKLAAAKVLPKEALAQLSKFGVDIEKLSDKTLPLNERLKELSKISGDAGAIVKVFGLENQQAGQILLENIPRLESLTKAVNENGVATQQASVNTDTFEFKQQRLKNTFNELKSVVGEYVVGGLSDLLDGYDLLIGKVTKFDLLVKSTSKQRDEVADVVANNIIKKSLAEQQAFLDSVALKLKTNEVLFKQNRINEKEYTITRTGLIAQRQAFLDLLGSETKATKSSTEETDKNTKATKENTKAKKENYGTFDEAIAKQNEELRKDQEEQDFEYAQRKKEREAKEREEEFEAAVKEAKRLGAIEAKAEEERLAAEKERREKARKELFDSFNQVIELAEKEIKEKERLREEASDKEIDQRQRNIDEQKRRAEQGLTNTLAFEEKALKDAEARKSAEEKKAVKREKTISFFKLLSANAESDPATALSKTLTEILLAEAIAGAFFKGSEKVEDDLKGNKVHNGRDGYVVAVDGKEAIMTGEQNSRRPKDMSLDELIDVGLAFQNGTLLPNYVINEPVNTSFAEKAYSAIQLQQLVEQNKELIKAVKNIPGTNINIADGYFSRTDSVNGYKTTTKKPLTRGYDS